MTDNYYNGGKYTPVRISNAQKSQLMQMHNAIYSNSENKLMPTKTVKSSTGSILAYTDVKGIPNTLDVAAIKNFGDTATYEATEQGDLWPDLERLCIAKPGVVVNDKGYRNILDENVVLLEVVRLDKNSKYGPYFVCHAFVEAHGIDGTFAIAGETIVPALEMLSGIELETGRKISDGELGTGVRVRFEYVKGGAFDGYFVIMPPRETVS